MKSRGECSSKVWHSRCPFCLKVLHRTSIAVHVRDVHLPTAAAPCLVCHRVFRTRNSLKNHMSVYHRGVSLRPCQEEVSASPSGDQ
ncbi:broad-complex core protein isoforms 1/2/3/4/5-like [Bacillus rossius redtenbacheri]|uniref:broad-complex core protein isoforms 1/2/3/4/5-like n=1 Tax=Bacillus rossius redtenbacheri TaxID=93214 RepID=UPI002FDE9F81